MFIIEIRRVRTTCFQCTFVIDFENIHVVIATNTERRNCGRYETTKCQC